MALRTDLIELHCNGCKVVRTLPASAAARVVDAESLMELLKDPTVMSLCPFCDSKTCDVRVRLPPEIQPS